MQSKLTKFKKIIKFFAILILIFLILFAGYYIWFKLTEIKVESFITSDFLLIFQTKNPFILFNKLDESQLLDVIFYNKEMKDIYKILVDVKSQLSESKQNLINLINSPATFVIYKNKKSAVIFNTGIKTPFFQLTSLAIKNIFSDSVNFKFTVEKYKKFSINKVTILTKLQSFYFSQIKNILIVATERKTLIKCIDSFLSKNNLLENENYLQVRAQIGGKKDLRIYFNVAFVLDEIKRENPKLYKSLKTLSILSIAGADLEIEKETVKINGFLSTDIKDEYAEKLFLSVPKRINTPNILPDRTSSFITLTFDNFKDVWNYFNRILVITGQKDKQAKLYQTQKAIEKILNISLEEFLFSWLDNEITISYLHDFTNPLYLISIKDSQKVEEVFNKLQKKNIFMPVSFINYKGVTIKQIKLSSFFQFFTEIIAPDLQMPYYIIYNEYIILSKNKELVKALIDATKKDELIIFKDKIKKLYSHIKKGNIISFWDLSHKSNKLFNSKNLFAKIIKRYNYGMLSMEFMDKGIKTKIIITEPRAEGIKLIDGWPLKFDSIVWSSPLAYNIDNKNLDEIIIGTEDGKIYIFDFFGENIINWPVKIKPKLKSSPFLFYNPKRKEICIGAVSSSGKIYLWDKEGFLIENFPISIEGSIEKTPIIGDINNDSKPEIVVANNNGKIYVIDINGNILSGFPVQLEKGVPSDILLVDLNNDKNYEILCSTKSFNGNIFFVKNRGEIIDDKMLVTGELNLSSPVVSSLKGNKLAIILVTGEGKLYIWTQDGELVKNFPVNLNDRFVNSPAIGDINNDGQKEVVLISSIGTLYGVNIEGKIIIEQNLNFRPIENEKIFLLDINNDNLKEIIIPCTDNYIRFYSLTGKLLFKIKGSTAPVIKDMDKDRKYEVLTACDDGNVYLYKIP